MKNVPMFIDVSPYLRNKNLSNVLDTYKSLDIYPSFEEYFFIHVDPKGATLGVGGMPLARVNISARDILIEIDGLKSINDIIKRLAIKIEETVSRTSLLVKIFINACYSMGVIKFSTIPNLIKKQVSGNLSWYSPRSCVIEITTSCDLRCKHCYANGGESTEYELKTEEWLSIIDRLAQGCNQVSITGGDPFVHKDFEKIISHAASSGMDVIVLTNGMRITEKSVLWLSEIGIKSVKLSLDGHNEIIHNGIRNHREAYIKAIDAIKILVNHNFNVAIGSTITNKSIDYILNIADLAYNLGAKSISFGRVLNRGRATQHNNLVLDNRLEDIIDKIDEVMRKYRNKNFGISFEEGSYWVDLFQSQKPSLIEYLQYRDFNLKNCLDGCGAGSHLTFISSKGEVKPCMICGTVLGKIKNGDDLVNVMKSQRAFNFKKIKAPTLESCNECENITSCLGCVAQGIEFSKNHVDCLWKTSNYRNGVSVDEFCK